MYVIFVIILERNLNLIFENIISMTFENELRFNVLRDFLLNNFLTVVDPCHILLGFNTFFL